MREPTRSIVVPSPTQILSGPTGRVCVRSFLPTCRGPCCNSKRTPRSRIRTPLLYTFILYMYRTTHYTFKNTRSTHSNARGPEIVWRALCVVQKVKCVTKSYSYTAGVAKTVTCRRTWVNRVEVKKHEYSALYRRNMCISSMVGTFKWICCRRYGLMFNWRVYASQAAKHVFTI